MIKSFWRFPTLFRMPRTGPDFFTGRTYRFNLRGALQQYVQDVGHGLRLDEIPAGFVRHWSAKMD